MYDESLTRIPSDEADMWSVLREQFEFVRHVLWDLPVETREEALNNTFHQRDGAPVSRAGMAVIRYKGTGEELDQRDYYLALGRELLPYIHQSLDEETLTPEFVQQWGKIMFCHGYVASYVFDDSDDLLAERNRLIAKIRTDRTSQRVFLARLILWFMDTNRQTRQRAEEMSAKAIQAFLKSENVSRLTDDHDAGWFKSLLRQNGKDDTCAQKNNRNRIVSSMEQKNASEAKLRALAALKIDGLPSIEILT